MSEDFILDPCPGASLFIKARARELADLTVKRFLPHRLQRKVGPFVFFDHMGPAVFPPGKGVDVRPHPHICLATITYLYEGSIMHRDSLGYAQEILPGEVNWMTAGRGIVHSERSTVESRTKEQRLHGLQVWVALPEEYEEVEPEFIHYDADTIPIFDQGNSTLTLIAGNVFGKSSPVNTHSPLFYLNASMPAGATVTVPDNYSERASYLVSGSVEFNDIKIEPQTMAVYDEDKEIIIKANENSELVMFGGDPITERYLEWNFVASSKERIEQAKDDWKNQRFDKVPGDEEEFIPLP